MHNYKELRVWQQAIKLATDVYRSTEIFPREEKFGLTSQIQRSAVSIPSNIAEGAGRNGGAEFKLFLSYAAGSSCELETQLIIAKELKYITEELANELILKSTEIQKMIYGLLKSLN